MRQTSLATYHEIVASGLLSKRRLEVYDVLFHHGPMSANDLIRRIIRDHPYANQTGWNARFSELQRMGAIKEVGTKKDEVSGHECIVWDVTHTLPVKIEKTDKAELKKELVNKIVSLGKAVDDKWKEPLREIYAIANTIYPNAK
ncbi:MAG: hypothetical protein WKF87_06935 [Chryseolinea sp.]